MIMCYQMLMTTLSAGASAMLFFVSQSELTILQLSAGACSMLLGLTFDTIQ